MVSAISIAGLIEGQHLLIRLAFGALLVLTGVTDVLLVLMGRKQPEPPELASGRKPVA
jgi:hypothetical protein